MTALSTEDIAEAGASSTLDDVVGRIAKRQRSSTPCRAATTSSCAASRRAPGEYYTDSQVSVYLDDQPMTAISQQVDVRLIDIERIEVLPGAAGHAVRVELAGRARIRYVTNKPDSAGYSSAGRRRDRHDERRRGKLRHQRPRQRPASATTSRSARSASIRRKAATSTTCWA